MKEYKVSRTYQITISNVQFLETMERGNASRVVNEAIAMYKQQYEQRNTPQEQDKKITAPTKVVLNNNINNDKIHLDNNQESQEWNFGGIK